MRYSQMTTHHQPLLVIDDANHALLPSQPLSHCPMASMSLHLVVFGVTLRSLAVGPLSAQGELWG